MKSLKFILTFSLVFFAVLLIKGSLLEESFTLKNLGKSKGVYADGWFSQNSELILPPLFHRANQLQLKLRKEQPFDSHPGNVNVKICGEEKSAWQIKGGEDQVIYLNGDCQPFRLEFSGNQTFVPSAKDQRELLFQVTEIKLSSKFGLPLVDISTLLKNSLAIFISFILFYFLLSNWKLAWLAYLFLPVAFYFLMLGKNPPELVKIQSLWQIFTAITAGALIAEFVRKNSARTQIINTSALLAALAVIVITAIAAALRFKGIDFGMPENYHPDEVPKYNAIMRMRQHGDLNPRYFLHPTLLLYSTYAANWLFQTLGLVQGSFEQTLIFSGRIVSALVGTCSCVVMFFIGRRLFSDSAGIAAGLLLAVAPLHVTVSRYVKEDALMTFWLLLVVYFVVRAVQDKKPQFLQLAAVFAGFSFATKYPGVLALVPVLSAPFLIVKGLVPDWRWLKITAGALILFLFAFVIASPYVIFDLGTFLRDFGYEQRHMVRGHTTAISAWQELWVFHIARSLIPGMTFVSFLAALFGIGALLCRRDKLGLFVLGLIALYYLPAEWVKAKPEPQPERYVVPCIPFLALAFGYFLSQLTKLNKTLALCCLLLVVSSAGLKTYKLSQELRPDTRELMREWVKKNIPEKSRIALDWRPYNPRFVGYDYDIYEIPRDRTMQELNFETLAEQGVDYLMLSSLYYARYFKQPNVDPMLREHLRSLFRSGRAVHQERSKQGTYGFHNPIVTIFAVSPRAQAKFAEPKQKKVPYL